MQVPLPRSPSSAHKARAAAATFLAELGRPDLADPVALIVSELVANAVMHARTDMSVSVELDGDGVRVSVTDGAATLPRWTPASATATSGRGLLLVRRLSRDWGVTPVTGGGKRVWATVDALSVDEEPGSPDDLLALWSEEPWPAPPGADSDLGVDIDVEVDVQAMLASRAHTDDLVRDLQLTLLAAAEPGSTTTAPAAVVALARRLEAANEEFGEPRRQMYNQAVAASQQNQERATLDLRIQPGDVSAARRWLEALDEADALTAAGVLLVPPFPAELVDFRRRYIGDIVGRFPVAS